MTESRRDYFRRYRRESRQRPAVKQREKLLREARKEAAERGVSTHAVLRDWGAANGTKQPIGGD